MPLERELKFRLAPQAAARAADELALGPGVALGSIYFDTPSGELSRARAALRLRRVGHTWLQAFKCERAPGVRGEWETGVPCGALELGRFPAAGIRSASGIDLAALHRRLRPLFETRFTRRAADIRFKDATVEVALDRGAIVAGEKREPLLELEIELKSGAASRMLRYAHSLIDPLALRLSLDSKAARGYRLARGEAQAPCRWRRPDLGGATPGEALARLAGAALEQVAANAEGVVRSQDPEYLHQLRVGLRRLRSYLPAFRALEPQSGPIRRRLRRFSAVLGEARDWDVFVQSLGRVPPPAKAARAAARSLVGSSGFNETLVRILRWIEEAPWRESHASLAAFAAHALERLHRKARKKIDWSDAAERHELRIRVKRLRYAADAFVECFPGARSRPYLAALERLQDDFGELNDIVVARRLMRGLGRRPAGLKEREKRLIARARRDWDAFAERVPYWQD
jgi:triphosphatase